MNIQTATSQASNTRAVDANAIQHVALRIGGMNCAHCPPEIKKALAALPGVISAQVNPTTKVANVRYDPAQTKTTDLLRTIRSRGYTAGTATARIPIKNMHCSSCVDAHRAGAADDARHYISARDLGPECGRYRIPT